MAEKKNMFGSFGTAVESREQEQKKVEATAKGQPAVRKRGAGATTITLAISQDDKMKFKVYAGSHMTTMSDMLHAWISELDS
ncbi:MAG: hypothetical protein LUI13_13830 [Lachnospiraceae bacterium]|nr:hypothetical protein [Lachnospiraceae bacterium]